MILGISLFLFLSFRNSWAIFFSWRDFPLLFSWFFPFPSHVLKDRWGGGEGGGGGRGREWWWWGGGGGSGGGGDLRKALNLQSPYQRRPQGSETWTPEGALSCKSENERKKPFFHAAVSYSRYFPAYMPYCLHLTPPGALEVEKNPACMTST